MRVFDFRLEVPMMISFTLHSVDLRSMIEATIENDFPSSSNRKSKIQNRKSNV